ncbi:MAG TPA: TlyA family RNA methyltransferase [Candidatus Sulfotelmatobacter sp.]|nr:TlyA family RNA methyltransferase [Candidatus Sulfotelmatobacter sp.]
MPARTRLDQLIVARGLVASRSQAQALLLAGRVRVGEGPGARRDRKPGDLVAGDTPVELDQRPPFVSRGGEKLAGALDELGVDPRGRACLDVGASTGGFTDCLLQRGARHVYALDVGRGQLAEALRADPRVTSMERTHARRLDPRDPEAIRLPEPVSLAVADVSFISLTRLLPGMAAQVEPGGELVVLVKPQFESRPGDVPKGVVRDAAVRAAAVERVATAARQAGLDVGAQAVSALPGPAGNIEIFLHLRRPPVGA